jgi:hypothetical protein
MKAVWLYRIAAVIFVLFAALHTYGFLTFRPASPEARVVWDGMNNVQFQEGGDSFSYGRFYVGFGLSATVSMLFSAFLAWYLSVLARSSPQTVGPIGWALFVVQLVGVGLSWKYFSVAPAMFSAALAACLGWAAWSVTARP